MTSRPPLLPHQATGVAWLEKIKRGLLADEPGMGKTRQMIEAADGGRTLVVAPALVLAAGTWQDEANRWARRPELFVEVAYSSLNARVYADRPVLDDEGEPVLDPDGSPKTRRVHRPSQNRVREGFGGPWDTLILDEAHYIKGRKTTWTNAVRKVAKQADQVFCATGTPVPNWAHELFTVLQLVHGGYGPGQPWGSFWRWAAEWFVIAPTKFSAGKPQVGGELLGCAAARGTCEDRPPEDPCEHWRAFTDANLGERYLRRTWNLSDLPLITTVQVETPLGRAGRRIYPELVRDYVTNVSDSSVVAWSTGQRNVLLDKLTVSPWFLTMEGEPRGGKLVRLRSDLRERTHPTLVFAHYRDVVEACARVAQSVGHRVAYVHGGVTSARVTKAIRDFRAGRLDTLVGSIEMLAEGLTLTVADCVIFVEHSYKPYRNEQARRRVWRLGQDRPVTVVDYVTPGTVDSAKRVLLATKTDRQLRLYTAAQYKQLLLA